MHVPRPKTVAESHAETTRMARRLFVSPPAQRMVLPILVFSLMESFLLIYPALDGWRAAWGAVAIVVPAYIAAYATVPLAERLGGRMNFRRSFLLVFVSLIMVGAIELAVVAALTLYSVLGTTTYAFRIDRAVVLGYGAVLWIRAVILTATSNSRYVRTLPAASLHPVLGLVGLAVFARLGVWDIVMAFAVYSLFFLSAVAYTEIAKRPLLRSFGADGLKLLRSTLDQYGEQEEAGIAELETFFDSISVRARVRVAGLAFLTAAWFAPNATDDSDGATGHAAVQEARLAGARDAIFVDAHNCHEPGVGLTLFGSERSHEIIQAAKAATQAALKAPKAGARVGYAARRGFATPDQGIGARGIEALVIETGGVRTAYVLFDGNNMVPGIRDEIRLRLAGLVQESEAMTSDNHSVNLSMDGFNAVGAALDQQTILAQAEGAVREAIANLDEAEVAAFATEIANFRIFGPQSASRLTTSINSTMAVLRPALYVTLSGAIALGALVIVLF